MTCPFKSETCTSRSAWLQKCAPKQHQGTTARLQEIVKGAPACVAHVDGMRARLVSVLEGCWQAPDAAATSTGRASTAGSSSSSSRSPGSSGAQASRPKGIMQAGSADGSAQAAGQDCDTQPAGKKDQQQQQQRSLLAGCSRGSRGSLPAYGILESELESAKDGLLSYYAAECSRVVCAAAGAKGLELIPAIGALVDAEEAFRGLAENLSTVGSALCTQLPVPRWCNNPGCTELTGASELQLVGGKGCVCGGCRVARYCSRSCQAAHWADHKPVCKQLAADAAAGGAGQ